MVILGKDGKEYNTVKECLAADKEYDAQAEQQKLAEEARAKSISARKKELSNAITQAEESRIAACQEYEIVKQQTEQLLTDAYKKAHAMKAEARKKVQEAVEAKTNAIIAFNKEFGAYQVTLTGNEALKEYNSFLKEVSSIFDHFFL